MLTYAAIKYVREHPRAPSESGAAPGAASGFPPPKGPGLVRQGAMGPNQTHSLARNALMKAQGWIDDGYFLQVVVHKAKNVGKGEFGPDAYVKLYLGPSDLSDCETKASTRVVYRNKHPIWEEKFLFPLRGLVLDEDQYLTAVVYDFDQTPFKDTSLGHLQWRLSMLLSAIPSECVPVTESYQLTDKQGEELMPGELVMQCTVLPPRANLEPLVMPLGKELYAPATLQNRFGSRTLQVNVAAIHGLRTFASTDDVGRILKDLNLEIRVGTLVVREAVSAQQISQQINGLEAVSLQLNKQVTIPLSDAFSLASAARSMIPSTRKKALMELGDVRLYLVGGSISLLKAQFPLWLLLVDASTAAQQQQQQAQLPAAATSQASGNGATLAGVTGAVDATRASSSSLAASGAAAPQGSSDASPLKGAGTSASPSLPGAPAAASGAEGAPQPSLAAAGGEGSVGRGSRVRRLSSPATVLLGGLQQLQQAVSGSGGGAGSATALEFVESAPEQTFRVPMERYGRGLMAPVEVELSAVLLSGIQLTSPSARIETLAEVDDEDVASAQPLEPGQLPAPLSTPVLEQTFACGPCRLFSLLTSANSLIMPRIYEKEGVSEVQVPPWQDEPQRRVVTYVRKLNIPMGPKSANIKEEQMLAVKAPGGWVMNVGVTTSAPKGDCFVVQTQVVAQRGAQHNTCSLRVTMAVDFVKSPGLLKGVIEGGATRDTKAHWAMLGDELRAVLAGPPASAPSGGVPAGAAAAAAPAAGAAAEQGKGTGRGAAANLLQPASEVVRGLLGPGADGVLAVACVVLVLLVLVLWWRAGAAERRAGALRQQLEGLQVMHQKAVEGLSLALRMCHSAGRAAVSGGVGAGAGGGGAGGGGGGEEAAVAPGHGGVEL